MGRREREGREIEREREWEERRERGEREVVEEVGSIVVFVVRLLESAF